MGRNLSEKEKKIFDRIYRRLYREYSMYLNGNINKEYWKRRIKERINYES